MSPSFSDKSLVSRRCLPDTSCGISSRFQLLSPSEGQVAHTLLTRPPLSHSKQAPSASFDLHVLGTPPAFVLSQDQTLNKFYLKAFRLRNHLSIAITSSQRNFQAKPFGLAQNPFWCLFSISFLTLFNLQGTHPGRLGGKKPLFPRGALLIYHRVSAFVKRFFEVLSGFFCSPKYCVFRREHYQYV